MKTAPTYQKLRGGYYTPQPIADFLADWAIQAPDARVMEPSCGDGNILSAAARVLQSRGAGPEQIAGGLFGVEIDLAEARKAADRVRQVGFLPHDPHVHTGDFFAYCKDLLATGTRFDAVIGNPPFVRYQDFAESQREFAFYLMQSAGLHPTRLTNAWAPFLVAGSLLLGERGRLAMVIPAELLQVNYAAELRYFLSRFYDALTLITFRRLVFDGIQQEIVLLLAERGTGAGRGIRTIEVDNIEDLRRYNHDALAATPLKEMDHSTEKWTMYFLDEAELRLIRRLRDDLRLTPSGQVLDVDVGIVTGLNDFFVLTEDQRTERALQAYTHPLVGRSNHLQGAIFSRADWEEGVARQAPAFLLQTPDVAAGELPAAVQAYVAQGESQGLHQGYKCRIRARWYVVPSVWTPPLFMLRQIHGYPKLILNEAGATCTDTIHRVRLRNGVPATTVAAAFLNSLTFAFTEIIGRSYGGGVLELEPKEAERLPIPLKGADGIDLAELDSLLRRGDIYGVLDITDRVLLQEGLGLPVSEMQMLRGIWEKMRDRRINRKSAPLAAS